MSRRPASEVQSRPATMGSSASVRRAMTLLELLMALTFFSIVITIAMQSVTGMQLFIRGSDARLDLAAEAQRVLNEITSSFSNSAWFIAPRDGSGQDTSQDAIRQLLATDPVYDRTTAIYYPFVYEQTAASLPAGAPFAAYARWGDPTQVVGPGTYDAERWSFLRPAHRLPSQEVTMLRVRSGDPTATPRASVDIAWLNFGQAPARMEDFNDPTLLPQIYSLGLRGGGAFVSDMPIDWENYELSPGVGSDPWATHPDDGPDPDFLREFAYRVVPDSSSGTARLERVYRDGAAGAVTLDRVISDKVDRMVVDTYRTSAELDVNQVRITIYLSEFSQQTRTMEHHHATITIALRSTVDPEYALNLQSWLGAAGSF